MPRSRLKQVHVWRLEHLTLSRLDILDVHAVGTLLLRPRRRSRGCAKESRGHRTLAAEHVLLPLLLSLELLLLFPHPRLRELSAASAQLEDAPRVSRYRSHFPARQLNRGVLEGRVGETGTTRVLKPTLDDLHELIRGVRLERHAVASEARQNLREKTLGQVEGVGDAENHQPCGSVGGPVEQVVEQLLRAGDEQVHLVDDEHGDTTVAAAPLLESPIQHVVSRLR